RRVLRRSTLPCSDFLLQRSVALRALHSFPTRRSSDLSRIRFPENLCYGTLTRLRDKKSASHTGHVVSCAMGGRSHDNADGGQTPDRKSTRLNSSHVKISYAVFCLKKKKNIPSVRAIQL